MSRRRALLAAALALLAVVAVLWFVKREPERPRESRAHAAPTNDDALARRLAAIRHASTARSSALPRYQLRGRVIDPAGSPVAGALVALGRPAMQTRSGPQGEFAIANLVPGRYAVEARKGALVGGPLSVQLAGDREVTLVLRRGAELKVEVVSADSGRPVPDADVRISLLSMYDHGGEQHARTDAAGIATFEGVTLVAHAIWVGADGFVEHADTVDPMYVTGSSLRYRVELAPGVTVHGRVVDADTGQPIAGAVVEGLQGDHREGARRGDDRRRHGNAPPYALELRGLGARSDREGRFRIGVSRGPWTIVASHPRYATAGSFIAVTDAPLDVHIALASDVVVRGIVVTENDLPVPGAEVEARWQFGGRVERTTRADGRGHFELRGLAAAPLELIARAADGTSTPKRFDLARGAPEDDVLLVIDNTGAITGRVVRAGQPVFGAQVFYVDQNPRAKVHPSVVNTDDTGAFRITGVARDRTYVLNAMPHQDGDAWLRTAMVEAQAGSDVTIEIPADGTLRGRVEVAGGRSADVRVELEGNTPPRPLAPSGSFAFADIPPGPRTLLFTGPGIAEHRVTVELKPGEDLDLGTIALAAGRTIAGKVVGSRGEPIADAELLVRAEGSSEQRGGTTREGTFSLVAPAGRELVVEARGRRGGMARVTVPATGASDALVLKLAGDATLEGAVTFGDDPVADAVVQLRRPGDASDRPHSYTQTDGAGYFRLVALDPGTYELVLIRHDPDTASGVSYARTIEIEAGKNYANTDLKTLAPR